MASTSLRIVLTRSAEKSLSRIPADRRRQILSRIEAVAAEPASRNFDIQPLAGSDLLRLRVGDYRVLFSLTESEGMLTVELVRTRGDVYKR
jgi:mRNA interferase RelE/StbE